MNYLSANRWAAVSLAIVVLLLVFGLLRRSKMINSAIDIDDLLLGDDGKISKAAAVMMGSFILTSWIMVKLTLTEHMTEGYLTVYVGAWIVPAVTKLIVQGKQP